MPHVKTSKSNGKQVLVSGCPITCHLLFSWSSNLKRDQRVRKAKHAFWHWSPNPEDLAIQANAIHTDSTSLFFWLLFVLQHFSSSIPCSCPAYHCTFTLTWSLAVPFGIALLLEAKSNFLYYFFFFLMKIVHPTGNYCDSLIKLSL